MENPKPCEQWQLLWNIGVDSQGTALQNNNTDLFVTYPVILKSCLESSWVLVTALQTLAEAQEAFEEIGTFEGYHKLGLDKKEKRRQWRSGKSNSQRLSPWKVRQFRSRGGGLYCDNGCGELGMTSWEMDKQIRLTDQNLKCSSVLKNSPLKGRQTWGRDEVLLLKPSWQRLGRSLLRAWQPHWKRQLMIWKAQLTCTKERHL